MRPPFSVRFGFLLLFATVSVRAEVIDCDVVIFGGTSAGVAAAIQAHRMGKSAVIAEWSQHLGGLTTGGLGATDIGNKGGIGGISREFYEQIAAHYAKPEAWTWQKPEAKDFKREKSTDPLVAKTGRETMWSFEPHVAMEIYERWLKDAGVPVHLGEKLQTVKKDGARIVEFTTEGGRTYRGKIFIDASYEGDLMAKAGVTYHVGREANTEYGETLNGFRETTPKHQFNVDVDPYLKPGDPSSGLLPFIQKGTNEKPGDGDQCVQAYNFRLCMTRTAENLVPWSEVKPANYDEKQFELLARYIEALEKAGKPPTGIFMGPTPMPNDKTDTNNGGAFSTDFIGENFAYPDADYATREKIIQAHADYIKGMLYFLSTSARVPQHVRDTVSKWGLARDEFPKTGHFPPQIYVREARRMISDYVMTEADCRWQRKAEDPVALGAYNMDSHNSQRLVQNGVVRNEGDVEVGVSGPYPVSYRSIVPKAAEASNLVVPVCLSATHVAYGSIRMEPVFMILGQSAATAASFAIDANVAVQGLDYAKLKAQLLKDGEILEWAGSAKHAAPPKLAGIILDDSDGRKTGAWTVGSLRGSQRIGEGYVHDENQKKGELSVAWTPDIPVAGTYEIIFHFPPNQNRATNVPVTVTVKGAPPQNFQVNERETSGKQSLGKFNLPLGRNTTITVTNSGTNGYVVVDGVQLLKSGASKP